jgi:hypothetical protein
MYLGETNNKYKTAETTLVRETENEVQLEEVKPNEVLISDILLTEGGGIIAFIFFFTVFLLMVPKRNKIPQEDSITISTNPHENLPCRNCQYFSNNHYLKCAIQPSLVMTTEAINCSDYCPKSSKFTLKNKLKFWR